MEYTPLGGICLKRIIIGILLFTIVMVPFDASATSTDVSGISSSTTGPKNTEIRGSFTIMNSPPELTSLSFIAADTSVTGYVLTFSITDNNTLHDLKEITVSIKVNTMAGSTSIMSYRWTPSTGTEALGNENSWRIYQQGNPQDLGTISGTWCITLIPDDIPEYDPDEISISVNDSQTQINHTLHYAVASEHHTLSLHHFLASLWYFTDPVWLLLFAL